MPYKSGLRPADYDYLHRLINSQEARVVVATSALEAGIDVDFTFGINMGLPVSKSALLQRMGRVGRRAESSFVVATGWGDQVIDGYTLYDYVNNFPLETPTLYPHNTSLQLAAGLCLKDEAGKVTKNHKAVQRPRGVSWPRGFKEAYERASDPWEKFAPHERAIIPRQRQKLHPQQFLPLRSLPSERFTLVQKFGPGNRKIVGEVGAETALREYTPGAIIRHMGQKYRVNAWSQGENGSDVVLSQYSGPNTTKAMLFQTVATSLSKGRIINGVLKTPLLANPVDHGFLSYMSMRVNLSVTSFVEFAKKADGGYAYIRPYRYYDDHELAKVKSFSEENNVDYGPKRHINYETFGVVIFIPEKWFGEDAREDLGERIVKAYCDKNRISPSDLSFDYKRTAVFWGEGNRIDRNVLVIYERGGNQVGLLEQLPGQLRQILLTISGNLAEAAASEGSRESYSAKLTTSRIDSMLRFVTSLVQSKPDELTKTIEEDLDASVKLPEGFVPVLEPNSLAKFARTRTVQETVRILSPALNDYDGKLGYWVQTINRKKFYSGSARWVTVNKAEIGKIANGEALEAQTSQQQAEAPVANRFVSAAHVMTEVKRPRLAMEMATGRLHRIDVDPETKSVELTHYKIGDEGTRSLLKHATAAATPMEPA